MHAEMIVLRFIHIVGGIAWVGSGIFTAFFLIPAVAGTSAMPQVMDGLQRRKAFVAIPTIGLLTVLTGLRLMWIDSAGFSGSFFSTGMGNTLGLGGAAAIIGLLLQVFVSRPAGARLGKIAAALLQSPPEAERARLNLEVDKLRRRSMYGTLGAVLFGLIAATAMAVARYV